MVFMGWHLREVCTAKRNVSGSINGNDKMFVRIDWCDGKTMRKTTPCQDFLMFF